MCSNITMRWMIPTNSVTIVVILAALLQLGLASSAEAQLTESLSSVTEEAAFPNDWYVRDGEGLEELRNLEGKPAKEISAAEWRGDATSLAQLKGKIVVLDFWATWCGPCMAAIPKNISFVEKYKDQGVVLLGIHDAKAGWDTVDQVISEKGINYTVMLDATKENQGETTHAYSLKFWPTYVIIDRDGIVRAAGIKPNKIEEAVLQLLSGQPYENKNASGVKMAAFPDKWFLGGDKRMPSSKAMEGQVAPKLSVAEWIGSPMEQDSWNQQVRVIQFVRPELSASMDQLFKLQAVAERFTNQGVVFVAVCDSRATLDRMKSAAEERRIEIPVAMDRTSKNDPAGVGVTSNSMGIQFAPATLVIDRAGILRAAGIKTDFLDKVLNQLLAESIPIQGESNSSEVIDEVGGRPRPVDLEANQDKNKQEATASKPEGDK